MTSALPSFSNSLLKRFLRLSALPLALAGLFLLPGTADAAQGSAQPPLIWQAGNMSVYAIQDKDGSMDISLFNGPATPEERAKYFTDGKTPAGVSTFLIRLAGASPADILVDTGYGAPDSRLLEGLAALGLTPENINTVLLTHMHRDHIGGLIADNAAAFPKAKVMVAKPELDFWLGLAERDPANANAAQVKAMRALYGEALLPPFASGAALFPGITAIDASGHTPGHTVFLLESGGKSLLIIGDLLHAASLQFPLPDECPRYDMDAPASAATRKRILNLAAEKNTPIAGMHIPWPGAGAVAKQGKGFAFTPTK